MNFIHYFVKQEGKIEREQIIHFLCFESIQRDKQYRQFFDLSSCVVEGEAKQQITLKSVFGNFDLIKREFFYFNELKILSNFC